MDPRRSITERIISLGGTALDLESARSAARIRVGNALRQLRADGRLEASDETIDTQARILGLYTSHLAADLACKLIERDRKK